MKRTLRFISGLLLLAGPAAEAQFNYTTNADDTNTVTITGYNGPGGALTIPTTNSAGLLVTGIGDSVFAGAGLTSVAIPGSVASIGEGVFEYCLALTNATMANGVGSVGAWAFAGTGLTSVMIPPSVTSIGDAAFGASLSLYGGGELFGGCASLTAIMVDGQNSFYSSSNGVLFDKGGSTLMQYPGGLEGSYTIPDSVTNIGDYAFGFTSLAGVTIPGRVTRIGGYAFAACTNLGSITIPGGVTSIEPNAFQLCDKLTSLAIPGSVTNIGEWAFSYCYSLTNAVIGNGVTSIGVWAFGQTSLSNVYFQGNAPTGSTNVFVYGDATVYYLPGATGWSSNFAGLQAVLWNPLIQTGDGRFGFSNNQFGFDISGTSNIPIVVEAGTNLASPTWTPLQTLRLTNGVFYFSDPQWTNDPSRYYRISSP